VVIAANKHQHVREFCPMCGYRSSNAVAGLTAAEKRALTVLDVLVPDQTACVVCGETTGVDWHHWLPQAIGEDTPEWEFWELIKDPLCPRHHAFWHGLVTPHLSESRRRAPR
jgi:hypothetical protein